MSIESNRLAMQRFLEFINTANPKMAEELIAADASFFVPTLVQDSDFCRSAQLIS